jgi:hypothetical protein
MGSRVIRLVDQKFTLDVSLIVEAKLGWIYLL